ncbi:unnamed protein product [Linum trigynum]|uniref:BHLH domain-containing protein n=1 Tax=Linum trigynum TaxID=586398 RepID=A0AAV2G777_9ROSI
MTLLNFAQVDQNRPASSTSCSMKLERKVVEKNRRNHMKTMYSRLYSLLPTSCSNQGSAAVGISSSPSPGSGVADRIDVAISYIKSMESKLKKLEEKKESLATSRKRLRKCSSGIYCSDGPKSKGARRWSAAPELQIRQVGSVVEVVLTSGSGRDESMVLFQDVIRILEDEGLEVLNASFAVTGNSTFFSTVHAKIEESCFSFEGAKASERLQRLVYGSVSDQELEAELWDLGPGDSS